MGLKKLPPGAVIYQNERFNIPPGWSKISPLKKNKDYVKITGTFTMLVTNNGTHDDWSFGIFNGTIKIRGDIASSRLAAMRKAEFHLYMIRKVSRG